MSAAVAAGVAGGLIPVIGGVIGHLIANGRREEAMKLREQVAATLDGVKLEEFDNIIAEQAQMPQDIKSDPALRGVQMDAIRQLQGISGEHGMDAQAKSALAESRLDSDQQARSQREAVLANRAQRGVSGSGDELVSSQMAGQAAAQRANISGVKAAGDARARALQAMMDSANLSGKVRGQDFGEQESNRNARTEMDKFNTGIRQRTNEGNANSRQAQNDQRLRKASRVGDARLGIAQEMDDEADRTEGVWSNTSQGVGKMVGAGGKAYKWDDK